MPVPQSGEVPQRRGSSRARGAAAVGLSRSL